MFSDRTVFEEELEFGEESDELVNYRGRASVVRAEQQARQPRRVLTKPTCCERPFSGLESPPTSRRLEIHDEARTPILLPLDVEVVLLAVYLTRELPHEWPLL